MTRRTRTGVLAVAVVVAVFALCRFAPQLSAQNSSRANTPEEAARDFLSYLSTTARVGEVGGTRAVPRPRPTPAPGRSFAEAPIGSLNDIIARKDLEKIGANGVNRMIDAMQAKTFAWRVTGSFPAANQTSATVQVAPELNPLYSIICVREGNQWRVDLVETFGKWLELDKKQKEQKIYELTSVALSDEAYGKDGMRISCQSNMKALALAMKQEIQDDDENYPSAKKWSDALGIYLKNEKVFHCPATKNYGYAMNWRLSKLNESQVVNPYQSVLFYESQTLRRNQSGEGKDIAYRHDNGTNIAFADGHVKWFKKNAAQKWSNVVFTAR